MPDLAVIMSVYHKDRIEFVRQSIQSILDQTFTEFDYYLIFDGPVSAEVENYITSLEDKRIKLFKMEKNSGLATALNFLLAIILKNSDYLFIARMDADDVSMPERFGKQRDFLLANPEISIVGCWYEEIDEDGKNLSYIKLPTEHEALRIRYFTRTPFAHPSVMYRRELIEKAGYYPTDTVLMEDNVLWGRGLKEGIRLSNLPEFLFRFRIDKDFFKRRSGIKYGWNYMRYKYVINKSLFSPVYLYFTLFGIAVTKMLPGFCISYIYRIGRH